MDIASGKLQIFQSVNVDESIAREEWHTYHPFTKSFNYSDEIEIVINQQDVFVDISQAHIYIEGIFKEETTTGKTGKCELSNNAGAFLFESVTYELNGKEIDKIRDPGLTSTVRALLCLNGQESKALECAGWNWPSGTVKPIISGSGHFNFLIPLRFLLNIFSDCNKVIMGKQKIKLVRARNDENAYTNKTGDKKANITIESIELKVRHVYPNDILKLTLLEDIASNKPIFIPFRSWEIHELPGLRKTKKDVWSVKSMSERARYVIVFFQKDRKDNPKSDITIFDNLDIVDVKLYLNSEVYPYESLNLNFDKKQFAEAYRMYTEFQLTYLSKINSEPLLDFDAFSGRTLFVIDCSKQNEALKSSTVDVKLEFQSSENFPDDTRAYCIIVHDRVFEYLPLSGNVRTLI